MQSWFNKHFRKVRKEGLLAGGPALGADHRAPPGACAVKHLYPHLRGRWRAHSGKSADYPKLRGKAIE